MSYLVIATPAIIGLVGLIEGFLKADTPRWKKRLIPVLAILTVVTAGCAAYAAYSGQKELQPWAAMRATYGRAVEVWALVKDAEATHDSAKLEKVQEELLRLFKEGETQGMPVRFRMKQHLFVMTAQLWAMSVRFPSETPEKLVQELMRMNAQGTPFEGRPDKFLGFLGFFRLEDFGPPHRILVGYGPDGSLKMNFKNVTPSFLLDRAKDFLADLQGMTQ